MSWQVGDGKQAKFCEDSWDGHRILNYDLDFKSLKDYFKDRCGEHISDYVELKEGQEGKV